MYCPGPKDFIRNVRGVLTLSGGLERTNWQAGQLGRDLLWEGRGFGAGKQRKGNAWLGVFRGKPEAKILARCLLAAGPISLYMLCPIESSAGEVETPPHRLAQKLCCCSTLGEDSVGSAGWFAGRI